MTKREQATAVVQTAPRQYEWRELELPDVGSDEALLALEACGVCGSDVAVFQGEMSGVSYPLVPGHEPVGRIARIGRTAAQRWALGEGDRVAVISKLRCGRCIGCLDGGPCQMTTSPSVSKLHDTYGFRSPDLKPGLWGGFSTHLFLPPEALIVPLSDSISAGAASLFNALSNGIHWVMDVAQVEAGMSVAILGCGSRGLAAVLAARMARAGRIVVSGLSDDGVRLSAARMLGADGTVEVSFGDPVEDLLAVLGGPADVVIDTTPSSLGVVGDAVRLVRPSGVVVLAGLKGEGSSAPLPVDLVIEKRVSLRGALSRTWRSTRLAVEILSSSDLPIDVFSSDGFALAKADEAIRALLPSANTRPLHVHIDPSIE